MRAVSRALWNAVLDFWRKGCSSLAASIAFFFLLSFIPLLCLLLFGLGQILRYDETAADLFWRLVRSFFPDVAVGKADLGAEIRRISSQIGLQSMVLVAFVWAAIQVFAEIDYAINRVFESDRRRNPLLSTVLSVAVLAVAQFVLVASYAVTQFLAAVAASVPRLARFDEAAMLANSIFLGRVLPLGLVLGTVTLLYRFLPRSRPAWRAAFTGALVFAALWELAKHLFALYVLRFSQYGRMYGSLLTVVLGLLWVYYSAALFLYCAVVVQRLRPSAVR